MQVSGPISIKATNHVLHASLLQRQVQIDVYQPVPLQQLNPSLLLLNDGQDLHPMRFGDMLDQLSRSGMIEPLVCVGIHAGLNRLDEYGTASTPDFAGRGAAAGRYNQFVLEELLPFVHLLLGVEQFLTIGFAGFSLGGLTALDIVWHHPQTFKLAGVFSGSLWWRSRSLEDDYNDEQHRIMHQLVRKGRYQPGLRFYFTTGSLDETADRNKNGITDSIDDTLDLIKELKQKGYGGNYELSYTNYEDGRHDVASWGRALPHFLLWGWGRRRL